VSEKIRKKKIYRGVRTGIFSKLIIPLPDAEITSAFAKTLSKNN